MTLLSYSPRVLTALALVHLGAFAAARRAAAAEGDNLAPVAAPSASHVSGDTAVEALNDGNEPRRSDRRGPGGSYGNWPAQGTQWVQYEWTKPISTNRIEVYWWDDQQGVRAPTSCRLLYWDGNDWSAVWDAEGFGIKRNAFNVTTFRNVKSVKLRLEIDGRVDPNGRGENPTYSTGILEWRVLDSGDSPDFPPRVKAGVDRVVVLGGKTHLHGEIQTLGDNSTSAAWSKAEGPGNVAFAKADAGETTATFSEVGDYVLKLTAGEGDLTASSTLNVKVVAAPEGEPLEFVPTKPYRITSPLWQPRLKAVIVNWIPYCVEKIEDPDLREGGLNNIDDAAKKLRGEPAGRHRGYWFSNAWVFNTLESMCLALMVDADGDQEILDAQQELRAKIENWIPRILAAQEPDGYLQTLYTLSGQTRWDPRHRGDHEGYVAGYFLEAGIAHYLLTDGKDKRLYDAAKKLADCWDANLGPPPKKPWFDGHQEMEQALARFGRFVNEVEGDGKGDRYIALAKFLLDNRDGGGEYDQSHAPVTEQYEAVGHAVRAVYNYSAMADVVMETGDLDYASAVESLWDNIVNKKYYVTGGVGSGETSEGFGPDYSLGNNAYCESCSGCGELFFQHKMNLIHKHGKYADLYEGTLYNAILGDLDLEGKNFYYQNPLDAGGMRYSWHSCPCCVGNIPRTFLMLPTWAYAKSDDGLYINLFIGSEVKIEDVAGTNVELIQETRYPWDGKVTITVKPESTARFALRLRSPQRDVSELYQGAPRADGITSISVNGEKVDANVANGYAVIDREWESGDKVELELPMTPQRVRASDKIAATRGRVALRVGPLVYNIERVDQNINGELPASSELQTEFRPDLLEGVLVIKSKFADGSDLLAIPNYARMNRTVERSQGTQQFAEGDSEGGGRRRRGRGPLSIVWMSEAGDDAAAN